MKEGESEAGGKVVEILEEGEQGGSWMAPRIWDGTRSRKLSGVGKVIIFYRLFSVDAMGEV